MAAYGGCGRLGAGGWQFVWQFFRQAGADDRGGLARGGFSGTGEGGGGGGMAEGLEAFELAAGAGEVAGDVCFVAHNEVRGLDFWHESRGYGFGGWGRE